MQKLVEYLYDPDDERQLAVRKRDCLRRAIAGVGLVPRVTRTKRGGVLIRAATRYEEQRLRELLPKIERRCRMGE